MKNEAPPAPTAIRCIMLLISGVPVLAFSLAAIWYPYALLGIAPAGGLLFTGMMIAHNRRFRAAEITAVAGQPVHDPRHQTGPRLPQRQAG